MKKKRPWISRFIYECEVEAERVGEASEKARKKMKLPKNSGRYMIKNHTRIGEHECKLIKGLNDEAVCEICGSSRGWWCLKSPDHVCHYYSLKCDDKGAWAVGLIDGTLIPKPKTANKYESDDWCMFCELPEERK